MSGKREVLRFAGLLIVGAGLFAGDVLWAQEQPGLSSGSGQGTGTGLSTGVQRNRSGSISGSGPERSRPGGLQGQGERGPVRGGGMGRGLGPGVDVRFPNDPYLIPFMTLTEEDGPIDPNAPVGVSNELLSSARLISNPRERSLALQRIADSAIFSNQLFLANRILEEAVNSSLEVDEPLVRDQRLIAIVTSLSRKLCVALLIEGQKSPVEATPPGLTRPADKPAGAANPETQSKQADGLVFLRLARLEWKRAAYLAGIIGNPTYRNQMLYDVSENASKGSADIVNKYLDVEAAANSSPSGQPSPRYKDLQAIADGVLVESFEYASRIDRLIWRYRAMVQIALQAADSKQYTRGVELARRIDNAESRTEALLLLAEAQCRDNLNDAATPVYQEAAAAAASIRQEGLRGVLVGFLVDSLIATGRFEDARACSSIYPEESQRLVALGSIAESQGLRGAVEAARRWISSEAPAAYRPVLYRRVVDGYLRAIEQNRGREFGKR